MSDGKPSRFSLPVSSRRSIDSSAFLEGIRQFNSWRFYECHETLEDLWLAEQTELSAFYQGIIKLAAGFHHLLRSNQRGALLLWEGGLRLLEPFRPLCLGVDVDKLLKETRRCYEAVEALGPERIHEFDRSLIPAIVLQEE
ncbi:MAG TPA: DUF309 domain-containing protein [Dehalococcoidia bacterium]|nr:DUF309 domain-containing protein [Dehalococcoidia bacterium]